VPPACDGHVVAYSIHLCSIELPYEGCTLGLNDARSVTLFTGRVARPPSAQIMDSMAGGTNLIYALEAPLCVLRVPRPTNIFGQLCDRCKLPTCISEMPTSVKICTVNSAGLGLKATGTCPKGPSSCCCSSVTSVSTRCGHVQRAPKWLLRWTDLSRFTMNVPIQRRYMVIVRETHLEVLGTSPQICTGHALLGESLASLGARHLLLNSWGTSA